MSQSMEDEVALLTMSQLLGRSLVGELHNTAIHESLSSAGPISKQSNKMVSHSRQEPGDQVTGSHTKSSERTASVEILPDRSSIMSYVPTKSTMRASHPL